MSVEAVKQRDHMGELGLIPGDSTRAREPEQRDEELLGRLKEFSG